MKTENPYPEKMNADDGSECMVSNPSHRIWNEGDANGYQRGYEARCQEMRDLADRLTELAQSLDAELQFSRAAMAKIQEEMESATKNANLSHKS